METDEDEPIETANPMRLPPEDTQKRMFDLAQMGDISAIRLQLKEIETSENDYRAFLREMSDLVTGFRINEIEDKLACYLGVDYLSSKLG